MPQFFGHRESMRVSLAGKARALDSYEISQNRFKRFVEDFKFSFVQLGRSNQIRAILKI